MKRSITRIVLLYALLLALAAFALEWLQYTYYTKAYSFEIYVVLIALGFAALGIWVGHRLTAQKARGPFDRNIAALESLGQWPGAGDRGSAQPASHPLTLRGDSGPVTRSGDFQRTTMMA